MALCYHQTRGLAAASSSLRCEGRIRVMLKFNRSRPEKLDRNKRVGSSALSSGSGAGGLTSSQRRRNVLGFGGEEMHTHKQHCLTVTIILLMAGTAPAVDRTKPAPSLALDQLAEDTQHQARIVSDPATGSVSFIRVPSGSLELSGVGEKAKALDFFTRYGDVFGLDHPNRELVLDRSREDDLGMAHLRFTQNFFGVPVFGCELRLHFDAKENLVSVNGSVVPHLEINPTPVINEVEAAATARRVVAKDHGTTADALESATPELMIYRTGLARGIPGTNHLVWKTEVGDGAGIREFVFVDAHRGFVVDRISGIHEIDREVHHRNFRQVIWSEGDALPFSESTFSTEQNNEVNDLINVASETFNLYSNITNGEWLSYDGVDRKMIAVYEAIFDPPCAESINASWNGRNTNFCKGLAVDDVIAHEWTHAYTDFTHNLIYAWQPGALNESYSDIFGEIVDMTNGHGLDSPNTKRSSDGCSTYFGNPYPSLTVTSPAAIAGSLDARDAVFNPEAPWSVSAFVEIVTDGTDTTSDACEDLQDFTSGRIALIDRGNCLFRDKVLRAQEAGAAGVIVANNDQDRPDSVLRMGGDLPALEIPAVLVSFNGGQLLKSELAAPVEATIALEKSSDNSVRWLVAEDGAAGAFRDMWNPNCMGDPARVSDSAYYCSEDDGGGVHSNSGIPNHAFALLVDGGTFNGVLVKPIGLTRAAHIYWRAMREYQVPNTDFSGHADALELACIDLVNQTLTDLVTGQPVSQFVRSSDCNQVAAAVLATEMRLEPSQCSFSRILEPDAPQLGATNVVWFETFDTDESLDDWTLTSEGVYPEYDSTRNWRISDFLPQERDGGALFAVNNTYIGNCQPNDDDQSGVLMAESPDVSLPTSATSLYLVFDHYVATESGWDGGNLKLSVNGGEFELVPASAFTFNPYNDAIISSTTDEENTEVPNTNPLAGEVAFTGADEGSVEGSWGQSQIDLLELAVPGDSIRIRFDFGNDGCSGAEGWFIDTLEVRAGGQTTPSVLRPSRRVSP